MNLFAQFVLLACIPTTLLLFVYLPPRRAVVAATVVSWCFLPNLGFSLPGLPDYTKTSATTFGVLLGAMVFDFGRVSRFRPRWYDLPIVIWCGGSFFTSLSNDLGAYDGVSSTVKFTTLWGLPYLVGRVYFNDLEGCRDLAMGVVTGTAVYVPICLWEIRMSPTLHGQLYGFQAFYELPRYGLGYRPLAFMATGLEVAVWMGAGSLCAYAFWTSGTVKRLLNLPFMWVMTAILVTTVLTKSIGAILLAAVGIGLFALIRRNKSSRWVWVVILTPPIYVTARSTGLYDGQSLIALTGLVLEDRQASLRTRIDNENMLMAKAFERPLLGWGGFSRNFVTDANGRIISIADGYWIIVLGTQGLVGLTAMVATFAIPQALFYRRVPGALWGRPEVAPAAALSIQVGLFMIDNLSNAMPNPIYTLALGGLAGLSVSGLPSSRREAAVLLEEADALKTAGHLDAAEVTYVRAIGTYADAPETAESPAILTEVAYAHEALADLVTASPGRAAEAGGLLLRAIAIHEAVAANNPDRPAGFERLADDFEHLGRLLEALGRHAESERAWGRAIELREGLTARYPGSPEFTRTWAESLNNLAWTLATRSDVAPETARTAAGLAVKAIELDPSQTGFWNTLGAANYQAGDLEPALAALQRSAELTGGGTAFDHYFVTMARARLGDLAAAADSFAKAEDWSRTHAPDHPTLARLRDQAAALIHASANL